MSTELKLQSIRYPCFLLDRVPCHLLSAVSLESEQPSATSKCQRLRSSTVTLRSDVSSFGHSGVLTYLGTKRRLRPNKDKNILPRRSCRPGIPGRSSAPTSKYGDRTDGTQIWGGIRQVEEMVGVSSLGHEYPSSTRENTPFLQSPNRQ